MSSATTFAAGDVLTIVAPATPDATLANLAWTLAGAPVATSFTTETQRTQRINCHALLCVLWVSVVNLKSHRLAVSL
jgi:hypothetical protein